jgi:hypothetical protein
MSSQGPSAAIRIQLGGNLLPLKLVQHWRIQSPSGLQLITPAQAAVSRLSTPAHDMVDYDEALCNNDCRKNDHRLQSVASCNPLDEHIGCLQSPPDKEPFVTVDNIKQQALIGIRQLPLVLLMVLQVQPGLVKTQP